MVTTTIQEFPVDPDFADRVDFYTAEQVAREGMQALAQTRASGPMALQLSATSQVVVTQAGQVINNEEPELAIEFNPPVENPIFMITNLANGDKTSGIGYDPTTLTSTGVTVHRGGGMIIGGLQDFSWVVISVPTPAPV